MQVIRPHRHPVHHIGAKMRRNLVAHNRPVKAVTGNRHAADGQHVLIAKLTSVHPENRKIRGTTTKVGNQDHRRPGHLMAKFIRRRQRLGAKLNVLKSGKLRRRAQALLGQLIGTGIERKRRRSPHDDAAHILLKMVVRPHPDFAQKDRDDLG